MVEVFAAVDSNVDFDGEEAVVVVTEVNVGLEKTVCVVVDVLKVILERGVGTVDNDGKLDIPVDFTGVCFPGPLVTLVDKNEVDFVVGKSAKQSEKSSQHKKRISKFLHDFMGPSWILSIHSDLFITLQMECSLCIELGRSLLESASLHSIL